MQKENLNNEQIRSLMNSGVDAVWLHSNRYYPIHLCTIKQCQSMLTYLLTVVLAILQSSNDLSVDEVCADAVQVAVMPGGEDLFAEVETPGGMLLLPTLPPHLLLTLWYSIHHMLMSAAERPYLRAHKNIL